METCLIIPDIHHKVDIAEKIIHSIGADKVIFTGDYFDNFGDSHLDATKTAKWLKNSLTKPNRIHLRGNHDLSYQFPNNYYASCSGFTISKSKAINEVLTQEDWNKLKFYHYEQGWFFSHAGIHEDLLPEDIREEQLKAFLDKEITDALVAAEKGEVHWVYSAGQARGGWSEVGGLTWCDFKYEFKPINFIKQAFGHTPQRKPTTVCDYNICLDTHLNYYGILKDGKIETFSYADL